MNESPIDPSNEAVPQPPADADGDERQPEREGTTEQADPRDRLTGGRRAAARRGVRPVRLVARSPAGHRAA